jgi:branched-chain amino acid aminotransferase
MHYFNYNGKILEDGSNIVGPANRGLRYGDGVFETMKFKGGNLISADEHFARLWKGMQLLQFEIPKLLTPDKLEQEIFALINKNKLAAARIRLTIIRSEGGLYDAKNHTPNYIIEATALAEGIGMLNNNGLQLCIYEDARKSIDSFSNIKHNNYLPYLTGALFAKKQQCNDALILNSRGNICDSTIANLFYIKDEIIYTPSLSEGCVAGVMRKWLIEKIREEEFTVYEAVVTKDDLMNADEVFLSNSIYNIRWAGGIENKKFENAIVNKIVAQLMKKYPAIYC